MENSKIYKYLGLLLSLMIITTCNFALEATPIFQNSKIFLILSLSGYVVSKIDIGLKIMESNEVSIVKHSVLGFNSFNSDRIGEKE